jgi:tetratricopeptide (TPR) repeat protein
MRRLLETGILLRLALLLLLIVLLGAAPRPLEVSHALAEAQSLLAGQRFKSASAFLAQAAGRLPGRADLWELAGRTALRGGDPQAAQAYLVKAAALHPLASGDLIALGEACRQSGDLICAVRAWGQVQPAGDDTLRRLLEAHRLLRDYPAATTDLQALTRLYPADPALRYQLGLLLAAQQPEAALAHLSQAAELDPSLARAAQTVESAVSAARQAEDPSYTLLASGRALAELEQWELAAEAFRQAALVRPGYAEAWAFLGEARQHLGDANALRLAQADLERAFSLDPNSVAASAMLALYWQRQERFDRALEYLLQAAHLDPRNPTLQVQIGSTQAILGDLPGALQAYQQAVSLAPNDPTYPRFLAGFSIKYEYHLREIGLPAARQAVLLAPDDPACLDALGQVFFLLGDVTSAGRFYERALQADPGFAPAHLHLGLVYLQQGDSQEAVNQFTLASRLAPGTPAAEQAQRLLANPVP